MKTIGFIFASAMLMSSSLLAQTTGTAINTTGAAPDPSAILDVSSTTQGVLFPRMTESERLTMPNLSTGLVVYQTDGVPGFWVYDGSAWSPLESNGSVAGDMEYWDGSQWVLIPQGSASQFLQLSETGLPTWTTLAGGGVGMGVLALITTDSIPAPSITAYGATCYSKIVNSGGTPITDYGICWSENPSPTITDNITWDGSTNTGNVVWPSTITGTAGTTYYVRAYATNSAGTSYGNELTVTIDDAQLVIVTQPVSEVGATYAISGGDITDTGGIAITAQAGICWSTDPAPDIINDSYAFTPYSNVFTSHIVGLDPGTTYYARAFFISDNFGTFYGNEITFTTNATLVPAIGETYAGGIIFYLDGSGEHGLVVAPDSFGSSVWGCNSTLIGGTSSAIGSGAANTAAIVAGCSDPGIPARVCDDLVYGGFSDWFLPSASELQLMYATMYVFLHWNTGTVGYAWSSTEDTCGSNYGGACGAFYMYCPTCGIGPANKGSVLQIRPVRAF